MDILERVISTVNPSMALKRAKARSDLEKLAAESEIMRLRMSMIGDAVSESGTMEVANSGYSHGGASRRKTWAKKYRSSSRSAKSDIELNRKLLRERSRDLSMNAPLGTAAINSTRTNCVGSGLIPNPKIDYEFLGISREEADNLKKQIQREFGLWAESTLCDNNDNNNFYELQQIVFADWLKNGEEFVLIKYGSRLPYMPYQLRLKLVEADRICTPGSLGGDYDGHDVMLDDGNRIMNGVEIEKSGRVMAYHIASRHPCEYGTSKIEWTRVEKRGEKTGNPNILHVFNGERAEQYRGVPFLSPVIQTIKQITRYTDAEIMAAIINSMFTVFITTENGNDMNGFDGVEEEYEEGGSAESDDEIELGSATVNFLKPGEGIEAVESKHPNGNYDVFLSAMANQLGAALEIAPEVLLKKFQNNFSASKGALNETWKSFKMRRTWFVRDFCQEVYRLWFNEAVSKGRINAPGYFKNPLIREAYVRATWNGPAQGHLNPVQEVSAAISRIDNGLSTHEDECVAMNGSDYDENVRTLLHENEILRQAKGEKKEDENGKKD